MCKAVILILAFCFMACSSTNKTPSTQYIIKHGNGNIGTYITTPKGFETSSYWIEGPKGLIFIDTQFLPSAAEESINVAEKITGKKVLLAIILHPNPDKFNGTLNFQKRGIRVVTSEQVKNIIPAIHKDRYGWFYPRYQPDYPTSAAAPDSFGNATQELSAGGVTVKAHVLGAGCSEAHVVIEYGKNIFTGDLVTNHNHSWLEIGKLDDWLKRIEELESLKPEFVYPGRGAFGGPELLFRQRVYLEKIIELVKAAQPRMPVKEETLLRLQNKIENLFPGYQYEYFLEIGLPAVWAHEAALQTNKNKKKKKK
ncbi:MAG: MBL fold metallo-hydrolase [Oligoflexia bacterium]|nr:MBL fold metallo-hydrolase [Oligoflexia bacterium]